MSKVLARVNLLYSHNTVNPKAVHWAALYPLIWAEEGAVVSEVMLVYPTRFEYCATILLNTMVVIVTPNDVPI
jgi:hypothetical protein